MRVITISLLSLSFLVLENNQFSDKSEQAKMWLFSSAMQRLRWTPFSKAGIRFWSESRVIIMFSVRKDQNFSLFLLPLDLCSLWGVWLPFHSFDGLNASFKPLPYFLQGGEAAPVVLDRDYICSKYFIWSGEMRLSQLFKKLTCCSMWRAASQTLLSQQQRRRELPSDLAGRRLEAPVRCCSVSS